MKQEHKTWETHKYNPPNSRPFLHALVTFWARHLGGLGGRRSKSITSVAEGVELCTESCAVAHILTVRSSPIGTGTVTVLTTYPPPAGDVAVMVATVTVVPFIS